MLGVPSLALLAILCLTKLSRWCERQKRVSCYITLHCSVTRGRAKRARCHTKWQCAQAESTEVMSSIVKSNHLKGTYGRLWSHLCCCCLGVNNTKKYYVCSRCKSCRPNIIEGGEFVTFRKGTFKSLIEVKVFSTIVIFLCQF